MEAINFYEEIKIRDGNPYVPVSKELATQIKPDWRKPMPVLIQVNGKPEKPWRINMMPVGDGSFYLYLHGDVRKTSGTEVGDQVKIEVTFDEKYRNGPMHPMPKWFSLALTKNPVAKKNWENLIPSRKREILRYLSWLKTPEARERNVARAMHMLSGKSGRFMARSWKKGK